MWSINLVTNTVKISKKVAIDLLATNASIAAYCREDAGYLIRACKGDEPDLIAQIMDDDQRLIFNPDHYEHMDYVDDREVQAVLQKHKVKGDICFASEEGDNAGTAWGYRFDGKGGMIPLEGRRSFVPVPSPKPKSKPKKASKRAAR